MLAGVGNVFKSEICFVNGLNPFRKVETLTREEAAAMIASAQQLLTANVLEDSGDTIVTYRGQQRRTTHASDPGASLWVYGRAGEPAGAAASRFAAASRARMRASPSGARAASPCRTARMWMGFETNMGPQQEAK